MKRITKTDRKLAEHIFDIINASAEQYAIWRKWDVWSIPIGDVEISLPKQGVMWLSKRKDLLDLPKAKVVPTLSFKFMKNRAAGIERIAVILAAQNWVAI